MAMNSAYFGEWSLQNKSYTMLLTILRKCKDIYSGTNHAKPKPMPISTFSFSKEQCSQASDDSSPLMPNNVDNLNTHLLVTHITNMQLLFSLCHFVTYVIKRWNGFLRSIYRKSCTLRFPNPQVFLYVQQLCSLAVHYRGSSFFRNTTLARTSLHSTNSSLHF